MLASQEGAAILRSPLLLWEKCLTKWYLLPIYQPQVNQPQILPSQGIHCSRSFMILVPDFVDNTQSLPLRDLLCVGLGMVA